VLVRTHAFIVYRSLTKLKQVLQPYLLAAPRASILLKACGSKGSTQVIRSSHPLLMPCPFTIVNGFLPSLAGGSFGRTLCGFTDCFWRRSPEVIAVVLPAAHLLG
jgi:hypothetical protein